MSEIDNRYIMENKMTNNDAMAEMIHDLYIKACQTVYSLETDEDFFHEGFRAALKWREENDCCCSEKDQYVCIPCKWRST